MGDAPEGRAIRVTYATHSSPQSAALLSHVTGLLKQQFPLRNVHWRPSPATRSLRPPATRAAGSVALSPHAIRTLQMLPVELVPLQSVVNADRRKPVLERTPCVHLFFVACDDNDVYRSKVRNEVRNWIASLPACMPQDFAGLRVTQDEGREVQASIEPEFLIVLVRPMQDAPPPAPPSVGAGMHPAMAHTSSGASAASKGAMGRFYNMNKGTVLEKLKADFNSTTHERVVHLAKLPGGGQAPANDPVIWIELMARMKENVANTIGNLVELQDRTITAYDQMHGQPGWSFCGSLARTERLIETLERVELMEDSLALYDELDQRLAVGLADGSAHVKRIGGTDPGDDSLLLLGPLRKPYQSLLEQETISLFDLRCYLFAQRAMLLGTLGHVVQVMQATPAFVASIAQMYAQHGTQGLPPFFVEAWSFSVSLDAVEQCQAWLVEQTAEDDEDAAKLHAFHAAKAELLELAIRQLLRIGILVGHLPNEEPFSLALAGRTSDAQPSDVPITRKELAEAMASRDVFDSQLRNLIHRSVLAASLSQQRNRLFRLKFVLSCLELLRGSYNEASKLFDELLAMDSLASWGPLHSALLAKHLACLRLQQLDHGPSWTEANITALQAVCATRCLPHAPHRLDEKALLDTLCASSEALQADATLVGYNGLAVQLTALRAERRDDDDGAWLSCDVISHLPFSLEVADVGVCVSNYQQNQLWFRSGAMTLEPGVSHAKVYCPMPATGFFHLQATQVRLGKHVFLEHIVQGGVSLSTLADAQQHEYIRPRVFLPADGDAARIGSSPQTHVRFDAQRHATLEVHSGRNALRASLVLEPGPGVQFAPYDPAIYTLHATQGTPSLTEKEGTLLLADVPPHTTCKIALPLATIPRAAHFEMIAAMRYHTSQSHADEQRTLVRRLHVSLALPLGIHIQDHFRLSQILSRLTLEASQGHYARTAAPSILAPEEAELSVEVPSAGMTVLAPNEPSAFLLRFTPKEGVRRTANAKPFRLTVSYRSLRDEALASALHALAALEPDTALTGGDHILLHEAIAHAIADSMDEEAYAWTGQHSIGAYDAAYWQRHAQRWGWPRDSAKTMAMLALVEALYERMKTPDDVAALVPPSGEAVQAPSDASETQRLAWNAAQERLQWRTLSLPLDVPLVNAVAAVTMQADSTRVLVGQPLEVTITIQVSLCWGAEKSVDAAKGAATHGKEEEVPNADDDAAKTGAKVSEISAAESDAAESETPTDMPTDMTTDTPTDTTTDTPSDASSAQKPKVHLQYNIASDYVHWLVWGDKKGTLVLPADSLSSTHTLRATLLPVHAGSLLLPRVRIAPVAPTPRPFHCETYMTNSAVCVDAVDPLTPDTYWVDLRPNERVAV